MKSNVKWTPEEKPCDKKSFAFSLIVTACDWSSAKGGKKERGRKLSATNLTRKKMVSPRFRQKKRKKKCGGPVSFRD